MDEEEFKSTYAVVNDRPCVFGKASLRRCSGCSRAQRLFIAEREAVACRSPAGHERCGALAVRLRQAALFALHMTHLDGPLPHGKEIKVECGGLSGLARAVHQEPGDVFATLDAALAAWPSLDNLPYNEIVKAVVAYQPRERTGR
jgi:hypothetical protein